MSLTCCANSVVIEGLYTEQVRSCGKLLVCLYDDVLIFV